MTDDDLRLAAELDGIVRNEFPSGRAFLEFVNDKTGWKGTDSILSKIRRGRRKMPEPLKRWVMIKVPFGAVYVEEEKDCSPLLQLLRRAVQEKEFRTIIHCATEFITAHNSGCFHTEGPDFLARLYAYRAIGHRGTGSVNETIRDYRTATDVARQRAPRLVPRYAICTIVWESESVDRSFKEGNVSKTYWKKRLEDMISQLEQIKTSCTDDETLRLKSLFRNSSRANWRDKFDRTLRKARSHPGFGPTPEKRDAYLRRWMSEKNDDDGDFKNARSYQSYADLYNR